MKIFFYGLFMDKRLLAKEGIRPSSVSTGFVDGFALRIGERATLVPQSGARAYGVVMTVTSADAAALYSDESVADYVAEPVVAELIDGTTVEAACYNLPSDRVVGANTRYAESLLKLAMELGFPETYLDQIRAAGIGSE